ncbi:MAG: metal ABC transporter ATP-binding protein [Fimbriimonadaceae bacterium]
MSPELTETSAPALRLEDVTVAYGRFPVLWDLDLSIPAKTRTAIFGPNGAGKSTLIKAALGLVPLVAGQVRFFGKPFAQVRNEIGYVPQRSEVDLEYPVDVFGTVMMGRYGRLGILRRPTANDREKVNQALKALEIDDLSRRPIGELSGGQQQRVFIARALAQEPTLLVLDEPFSSLDVRSEKIISKVLEQFAKDGGTVLAVHHDIATIEQNFDELVLLKHRVIDQGPVPKLLQPERIKALFKAESDES